ncbi:NAD(P)H-quinone oxidoreductase [Aeromicrobium sp. CTD01-1L150]|uniref:NAD(P)H-quinone oxidoreductase n=1 Tax=Aeromicrobium sp. CTD01-1L150 TaxID=3341830 RepID=UPI0035C265CC
MRAVLVHEPGDVDALQVVDHPAPEIAEGEVLVDVRAAGVNRADLLQRRGFYDPPPGATPVLGLEASGVVSAVAAGVDSVAVGEEVVCLLGGGGYAEQVAVPAGQVAPLPDGLDLLEAGGLMETAATVWSNVFMTARLCEGETLLVHGGASGIGTTAIQLAKAFGARVVVTVGSEEKAAFCRDLGADLAINYREQDFVDVLTEQRIRPDVILDIIGAKYLPRNVAALATGGRIVVIGLQGGIKGELDLGRLLAKRASITATSLRARPLQEKAEIVAGVVEHVWPLVTSGRLRPIIHDTFGLDDVRAAHQVLEDSSHTGKVLLTP